MAFLSLVACLVWVRCFFFFFSSRRRHTRLVSDWSSDVCSSDLVNFMDGIDWMTVAEVVPVTAALWIASWFGALTPVDAALAIAVAGAMLGFAPFNRPVARLFLGDVGSLPLGLLLFWLLLRLAAR